MKFDFFKIVLDKPVIKELIANNANVYAVGGCVRDALIAEIHEIKTKTKDIDIIVQNMEFPILLSILNKFGKADLVGQSFGVIKYKEDDDFELDIALPRKDFIDKENISENAHTAIIAQSDPYMPIESDLERRDFTINSIAISQNLILIDPFNGVKDIENKIIKATNFNTFQDDPLRLLRAVRFSLRYNFIPDKETYEAIQKNSGSLKKITAQRKFSELESMVKDHIIKNDITDKFFSYPKDITFLSLLSSMLRFMRLYEPLLGFKPASVLTSMKDRISTVGELLISFRHNDLNFDYAKHYKTHLKVDNDTEKELNSLTFFTKGMFEIAKLDESPERYLKSRWLYFNSLKLFPKTLNEPKLFKAFSIDFALNSLPKTRMELAVDGNDLMELGFKGKEISEVTEVILNEIFKESLKNNKEEILRKIKNDSFNYE